MVDRRTIIVKGYHVSFIDLLIGFITSSYIIDNKIHTICPNECDDKCDMNVSPWVRSPQTNVLLMPRCLL